MIQNLKIILVIVAVLHLSPVNAYSPNVGTFYERPDTKVVESIVSEYKELPTPSVKLKKKAASIEETAPKTTSAPQTSIVTGSIPDRLRALGGEALVELIRRESTFNVNAVNPSSGACGLFQRLPCSIPLGNADAQIKDGWAYILARYGSATAALQHHDLKGWY